LILLLAQAADGGGGNQAKPGDGVQGLLGFLPAVAAAIILYYFLIIRPERRKSSAQRTRLDDLKKNDRVVTIGGIYGVVMSVQRDADEVTLKIDEANNTKIRVRFSAIASIIGDEPAGEKSA
jgi:preprotein translocase subunit YajC